MIACEYNCNTSHLILWALSAATDAANSYRLVLASSKMKLTLLARGLISVTPAGMLNSLEHGDEFRSRLWKLLRAEISVEAERDMDFLDAYAGSLQ